MPGCLGELEALARLDLQPGLNPYGGRMNERDSPLSIRRFSMLALMSAMAYFLVVGVATAVLPSPFFVRKLGVDVWNVASLVIPALLFGPLAATYLVPWPNACRVGGRAGAGGVLSFFAAGCPVCNKLVVLAIGTTGAVEVFRPLQPLLGALSILMLGIALWARWQTRPAGRLRQGRDVPRLAIVEAEAPRGNGSG